jgi:hypothetical protein
MAIQLSGFIPFIAACAARPSQPGRELALLNQQTLHRLGIAYLRHKNLSYQNQPHFAGTFGKFFSDELSGDS